MTTISARAEIQVAGNLGVRLNSASTDVGGASVTSKAGIIAGFLGWLPLRHGFGVRSGALYNQRFVGLGPTNQGDIDVQYTYLDIPLTATYQINSGWSIFGGPVLAFNQSRDVTCSTSSTCAAAEVNSFVLPWQAGVDFKMTSQLGGEFFVEGILGEVSKNISDMKSLGLSLVIFFN